VLTWLEPAWLAAGAVLAATLGLGFLLFIHEFGHYFVAKRAGVKVEVFSMGMCHFLLTWTRRGTVYALSWLPVGGYVRMAGQQDLAPPPGHQPLPHEYGAKSPSVRMAIIVAGVAMNFIGGYLCFASTFLWGREVVPPIVGRFDPALPRFADAWRAGLRPGDRVLAVDGDPVHTFMGLRMRVLRIKPGSEVDFLIEHQDGAREHVRLTTFEGEARGLSVAIPSILPPAWDLTRELGFAAERRLAIEPVAKKLNKFPGWRTLFEPGDEIVSVNGQPCGSEKDMVVALKGADGRPLQLVVRGADGRERPVSLPVVGDYTVGIVPDAASETMKVAEVLPGTPAAGAGVRAGDEIFVNADGQRQPCAFREFRRRVQQAGSTGKPLAVTLVAPGGDVRQTELRPRADTWYPNPGGKPGLAVQIPWGDTAVVRAVSPGSSAAAKGLQPGAVLIDVAYKLDQHEPVTLTWGYRGRERGPHRLYPFPDGPAVGLHLPRQEKLRLGLLASLAAGWQETRETLLSTTVVLKKMTTRQISGEAVTGPLGIVSMTYHQAQEGLGHLLWFLGMMGISLAFINLLPIPVLDGGHLVFLVYEGVTRRRPSPRLVEVAQYAGLLVILAIFAWVFKNDITRMFLR
jgi:regulator of sigma E protease